MKSKVKIVKSTKQTPKDEQCSCGQNHYQQALAAVKEG